MGITMIVTTCNRGNLLARSLKTLSEITAPDEIIVVDDGGDDNTWDVCRLSPLPVRYVYNQPAHRATRCQPSNVAIRMASHEHVLHADPELEFVSDVVAQFREHADKRPEAILAPEYAFHDTYRGCPLEECVSIYAGDGLHKTAGPGYMYRRQWLLDVGGWDESLVHGGWDDLDLHMRLSWAGHVHEAVPGTVVRHRWHPEQSWEGAEPGLSNKPFVEAKQNPQHLVANPGVEWGVLRT